MGNVSMYVWRVPASAVPASLWRMAVDPRRVRREPGVRFVKLLGTGRGRQFGPTRADPTRWAALAVYDRARPGFPEWERHAVASCRIDLAPLRVRGSWAGRQPFTIDRAGPPDRAGETRGTGDPTAPHTAGGTGGWPGGTGEPTPGPGAADGTSGMAAAGVAGEAAVDARGDGPRQRSPDAAPVLALTRARLRPSRAATFWRATGPVAAALAEAPGLLAAFAIGEAPLGWQGTVSLWRKPADLSRFAYRHPQHRQAIERTTTTGWYAEELFARFAVLDVVGDTGVIGWGVERHGTDRQQADRSRAASQAADRPPAHRRRSSGTTTPDRPAR